MTLKQLEDQVTEVWKALRLHLSRTIGLGVIVVLSLVATGYFTQTGQNLAPFQKAEPRAAPPDENGQVLSTDTATLPPPTASSPSDSRAPGKAHRASAAPQPSRGDTSVASSPQPKSDAPVAPEPPALTPALGPSREELIRLKEGRIPEVAARLDRDRNEIDQQAWAASQRFTQLSRKAKLTPNEKLQLAAEDAALKRSLEISRGLIDIKTEVLRLAPEHIAALRSNQDVLADDLYRQITEQLHDRYLQLLSNNVGYDSPHLIGVTPPHYLEQFEHVTLDVLKLTRGQPTPDTIFDLKSAPPH